MQTVIYRITEKGTHCKHPDIAILLQVVDVFSCGATYFQIAEFLKNTASDERYSHVQAIFTNMDEILSRALDEGYLTIALASPREKSKYPMSILVLTSKL